MATHQSTPNGHIPAIRTQFSTWISQQSEFIRQLQRIPSSAPESPKSMSASEFRDAIVSSPILMTADALLHLVDCRTGSITADLKALPISSTPET